MSLLAGYLLVRSGGRLIGLPLDQVVEVLDPGSAFAVPARESSFRGVALIRGRILPVIHLGALLDGTACPTDRSSLGVLVDMMGRRVCFEVDEAESVHYGNVLPAAGAAVLPWSSGVARTAGGLVPLLDLAALAARYMEASAA